jgi:site-specific DNA recombinase
MRRIALYCRVSTENQEKSETIENQLRDLYKVYNKAEVVKVYQDNPGSGADPDRVGLNQLRKDAQKKMFDVIGIWASDRLARDLKLSLILRDEFKELGVAIEIMGKEREDSDTGKLMSVLEATMDEIERGRIKRRFLSGRDRRLSEGKLIGCYPPYGYYHIRRNKEKGTDAYFKINEQEARLVKKIFKWYLELESIFLVTKRLMQKGIKTRGKNKSGKPNFFFCSTVSKILRREDYIGEHYVGKSSPCIAKFHISKIRKHRLTGRSRNPRSEWKSVKVPPIIDKITFRRVQALLEKRAKRRTRKSVYEFLCSGLIRCVRCHRLYGGKHQRDERVDKDYFLYRCPQAHTASFNEPACKARTMSREKLDNAVWAYVSELINDKKRIEDNLLNVRKKRESEKLLNQQTYDTLLLEKKELKAKKGKLLELYSEDGFSKEDLKIKMVELDERERGLDAQIAKIKVELEGIENIDAAEKELEKIRLVYRKRLNNASFELRKFIVKKWVEEININDDGSLKIKVKIPEGEPLEDKKDNNIFYVFGNALQNSELLSIGLKFEEVIIP